MDWQIQIKINEKLYLRNPQQSDLGKRILIEGASLIDTLGLEEFTFRKLAHQLKTNESSVYRYFENKHRLLLYLFQWYWKWMDYQLTFYTQNITDPSKKIETAILLLLLKMPELPKDDQQQIDVSALHRIVIKEASKVYLTSHVKEDNQNQLFKPYKDFNARIAGLILEINPKYPFARSLSSTVIEMSHYQSFFMINLPSLTDFGGSQNEEEIIRFLKHLIMGDRQS